MSESILRSNWDVLLIMLPFLVMMAVGMFRLDEHLFASKASKAARGARNRTFCGQDGDGHAALSDPDGRPCRPRPMKR